MIFTNQAVGRSRSGAPVGANVKPLKRKKKIRELLARAKHWGIRAARQSDVEGVRWLPVVGVPETRDKEGK